MGFLKNIFKLFKRRPKKKIPVVLAINAVDLIEPCDWNTRINQPSEEQEVNIEKKCKRLVKDFSRISKLPKNQIVYYSALQYYRTTELLTAMITASKDGFILSSFPTKTFVDKITDPAILELLEKERQANPQASILISNNPIDIMIAEMKKRLKPEDFQKFEEKFNSRMATPPRIMFLGKTGVGKTTTVAALLGKDISDFSVSHTTIGTQDVEVHTLEYPNGDKTGQIELFDLPGYGTADDSQYIKMYEETLPQCDLVVLIVQANDRSFADDEQIIKKLVEWYNK